MNRRLFINQASTSLLLPFLPFSGFGEKDKNGHTVKIGFIGKRSHQLMSQLTRIPGVNVNSYYDGKSNFSDFLRQSDIDALVIATTGSAGITQAIAACQAGKSVYLIAPSTYTAQAGETFLRAAQADGVVLQTGYLHRSLPSFQQAVAAIQEGLIGTINRTSAWRYTNGESGVNSVPIELDCCRWFMGVDYPTHVKAFGNVAEGIAPAQAAQFTFGDKISTWQCLPHTGTTTEEKWGFTIYGDKGVLSFSSKEPSRLRLHDPSGKRIPASWANEARTDSRSAASYHMANFIKAVQGTASVNAAAEAMHKSQLLRQLAAISHQVGEPLVIDPATGRIEGNPVAMNYWNVSVCDDSSRFI